MKRWIKPTKDTKFHIDFSWWEEEGQSFRLHLLSHLCPECQVRYQDLRQQELIDWVDPDTGEVTRVDGLWHALRTCCSTKQDYINDYTPLITAIFRTFLANGNTPLTPLELEQHVHRSADTILRTIGGLRVYHGIKPVKKQTKRPEPERSLEQVAP
jgi:hypothetical protein